MELICIQCPRSCHLNIEGDVVTGNGCKRGEAFAKAEAVAPMRSVTTTVATRFKDYPVLPVKTDGEIPKDQIFELMKFVSKICVDKKIRYGEIVSENILGTGVNLVATATVRTEEA